LFSYMLLADIFIAYVLDIFFGDPYWLPHPVRFIGWLIRTTEAFLRKMIKVRVAEGESNAAIERRSGVILTTIVVGTTFLTVLAILLIAGLVHPIIFHVANIYFIYSALASTCLAKEARKVYGSLKVGNFIQARKNLSMLVARNTENLSDKEVIRGTVETVAENTVDGVVSPLLYATVGSILGIGAPLAYAFKAVSTLDSMVGYMNEKYINLGRASAKTDDAANYIPARISGLIIPVSALFCRMDYKKSFSIMVRDRRNHKSPNCAFSEAAVAGALGVRLGGNNVYFGKVVEKPTIGDAQRELRPEDIRDTIWLMYITSLLTLILGLSIAAVIVYIFNK
jgi:adenosylcobinamide-phosphate synthase